MFYSIRKDNCHQLGEAHCVDFWELCPDVVMVVIRWDLGCIDFFASRAAADEQAILRAA